MSYQISPSDGEFPHILPNGFHRTNLIELVVCYCSRFCYSKCLFHIFIHEEELSAFFVNIALLEREKKVKLSLNVQTLNVTSLEYIVCDKCFAIFAAKYTKTMKRELLNGKT